MHRKCQSYILFLQRGLLSVNPNHSSEKKKCVQFSHVLFLRIPSCIGNECSLISPSNSSSLLLLLPFPKLAVHVVCPCNKHILALIWTDNPHLTLKSICIIKHLDFINKYQQCIASVTVHNFVTEKEDNNLSQPGPWETQSEKYTLTNSFNNIEPLFPIQQLCIYIRDAFPPANGVATHHDVLVTWWVPWHSDGIGHWPSCNKNAKQDSLTP
jgi:hypothetical protein